MSVSGKGNTGMAAAAEAAEWFIDLQAGDISRERQEAFADWLRRSPVHVEEFLQLTALRGDLARLPELDELDAALLVEEAARADGLEKVVPLGSVLTPERAVLPARGVLRDESRCCR